MKRIIILSIMFFSILCTYRSCLEETDQSKCTTHTFESKYNFLSCFKIDNDDDENRCMPFFTNENSQKAYTKFYRGLSKEDISVYPLSETKDSDYFEFDKDSYGINDIIKYKKVTFSDILTEEDIKIINKKNTCEYQAQARFADPDNYQGQIKINISDANVCYNIDRFEDSKDLLSSLLELMHDELNFCGNIKLDYCPIYDQTKEQEALNFFRTVHFNLNNSVLSQLFHSIIKQTTNCQNCKSNLYNFQFFQILTFSLNDYIDKNFNIYRGLKIILDQ